MIEQLETKIRNATAQALNQCFGLKADPSGITLNRTKRDFVGQVTVVVFPYVKLAKKSPEQTGQLIGEKLAHLLPEVKQFNTVKGFLNLELADAFWLNFLSQAWPDNNYGQSPSTGQVVTLEYCGPNTNKPLHLGHIRNMLLGWSTAELLSKAGHEVHKVNIYNDRGIAICKSMAAYQTAGNGSTPETEGVKSDHFVGAYYVRYNQIAVEQSQPFIDQGMDKREAEKQTAIYSVARDMLLKWEDGDKETRALWSKMNGWVYEGFRKTYESLGVDFEKDYLESETYLAGKEIVLQGEKDGVFNKYDDGSIRADLTAEGLDEKLLLRSDGSSMYITQDLGTAQQRYNDYKMDRSIYVVGSEQEYHFKVLTALLKKLGKDWADGIYHQSYGMVDLPSGKMKSREGTTVDADDLISDMTLQAKNKTLELGKTDGLDETTANELYRVLGLGALKYFILKVDPRKRILFNPAESIELVGNTGPFIQYTHARIQSMIRKFEGNLTVPSIDRTLEEIEVDVLALLFRYPGVIREAAANYSPAEIANYAFEVAKTYNQFYDRLPVLHADKEEDIVFRVLLSAFTARVIRSALGILGIESPERM